MLQVGDVIHILSSNADAPEICTPAIVAGKKGGNWWVLTILWTGARAAFMSDTSWHLKEGCDTETGKAQD